MQPTMNGGEGDFGCKYLLIPSLLSYGTSSWYSRLYGNVVMHKACTNILIIVHFLFLSPPFRCLCGYASVPLCLCGVFPLHIQTRLRMKSARNSTSLNPSLRRWRRSSEMKTNGAQSRRSVAETAQDRTLKL